MSAAAATRARRRRPAGLRTRPRGPRRAVAGLLSRLSPRSLSPRSLSPRSLSPRARRRLLVAALLALALLAAYRFWLRDSSLVAVERVTVSGLTAADSERLRASLTAAGRTMTTLNVDTEALERAAAAYPVVRDLEVSTDFPHGLRVHVIEHHPVAIAATGSSRVPVAADGTILRGLPVEGRLPTVDVRGSLGGERLADGHGRAAVALAGAAPAPLRSRVDEVERRGGDGLVAELRDGPELIFGSARRLRAKWAAAARVLADLEARGATYVDLRIPGRPAVGGLPAEPAAPADVTTTPPTAPSTAGVDAVPAPDPTTGLGTESPAVAGTDPAVAAPTGTTAPPASTTPSGTVPVAPAPSAPTAPAPATGGAEGGATATP